MAERRMFAKTIVLSDAFLDMPMSARCLYFTLGMFADDDGFVNSPRGIMRQCGASNDDMKLLIAKKFVICFDSGVIVIKHWRINNYLRSDRYSETKYKDEKNALLIDENGAYSSSGIPGGIPGGIPTGIPRLGKDRLGKDNKRESNREKKFVPPTLEEVQNYCKQRENDVDPSKFFDYFNESGWVDSEGKPVRNWKQKVITWEHGNSKRGVNNHGVNTGTNQESGSRSWNIHYDADGD